MKLRLIPHWRKVFRLYSTWWILVATLLASTSPFVDEIRDYFGLGLGASILLTAAAMLAGLALRMLAQEKVSGDDEQRP